MSSRKIAACVLVTLAAVIAPSTAQAFEISGFAVNPADRTAGAHPDLDLDLRIGEAGDDLRDLQIDLPAGLVPNPRATSRCTVAQLNADACPAETAVGSVTVDATAAILPVPGSPGTVYNLETQGGEPARLGIVVRPIGGTFGKITLQSPISVRDETDFGITARIAGIPNTLSGIPIDITRLQLRLLGRLQNGNFFNANPSRCDTATTVVTATARTGETARATSSFAATDCATLPTAPTTELTLDDPRADVATALNLTVNQPQDVGGRQHAQARKAVVRLPEGIGLSAPLAETLEVCTPAQFGPAGRAPNCPAASDTGEVRIESPVVPTLRGEVFFAGQIRGGIRLFLTGIVGDVAVKLTADLALSEDRIATVATLDGLPQVPFTQFFFRFDGQTRRAVVSPGDCGTFPNVVDVTPQRGEPSARTQSALAIGGCPLPFAPTVDAAASTRQALASPTLDVGFTRPERTKRLRRLETTLPRGLLARLASVPQCQPGDATRGTCPASTRIGRVSAGVGAGPTPVTLPGTVSLGTPIGGGIASLAIAVPARVGPVDLGTFVLRAPVRLGKRDARLTVDATLPEAFGGIPIPLRRLGLRIDRDEFLVNGSGCEPRSVDVNGTAFDGTRAGAGAQLGVTGCERLDFAPRLTAEVDDARFRARGTEPPLTVEITKSGADAGLGSVDALLPIALQGNVERLRFTCRPAQLEAGACPPASRLGVAEAKSPLLPETLSGPVFFVTPDRPRVDPAGLALPDVVAVLRSPDRPLELQVQATLSQTSLGGRLRAVFGGLPDVPLDRFRLRFDDGEGDRIGAFSIGVDLCSTATDPLRATITGQNGAVRRGDVRLDSAACRTRPRAKVRVTRLETTRPTVSVRVERAPRAGALARVRVRLPRQLRVEPRAVRRGVVVRADGRRLPRRAWTLGRTGTLRVDRIGGRGAQVLTVTLNRGAVVGTAATRRAAARRNTSIRSSAPILLPFVVSARDTGGRAADQTVTARFTG